jgi:hypothetical protein
MSTRLFLLALTLFTAEPALAQAETRRGFIGLDIGPSVPFGNFADASPTNAGAGRAESGYNSTLVNVGYRIGQGIGVAGAISYGEYVMKGGGGDDWWQMAALTIGPMYSLRLGAKSALDVKAMVGLVTLWPVIDNLTTSDAQGSGLGADLRATVRYDVLRRWAVFAEGGLQASNVSFPNGDEKEYRALISGFGIAFRPAW